MDHVIVEHGVDGFAEADAFSTPVCNGSTGWTFTSNKLVLFLLRTAAVIPVDAIAGSLFTPTIYRRHDWWFHVGLGG
jgi:hypothetical protein